MAAPIATASSGFTSLRGSLPNISLTLSCTLGIRDCPPTKIISSISATFTPASLMAVRHGPTVRSINSSTRLSNLARVILIARCLGPEASAVIYGKLTSVCWLDESSILAFSAASLRRCSASTSFFKSMPLSFLNSSVRYSITRESKSSPPRKVSPLVAKTSNWCSPSTSAISIIEISKVPPPRSYTATLRSPSFLSIPKASAAAVGSLMIRLTSSPAIRPASLVAWR